MHVHWCPSIRCVSHEDSCQIEHSDIDLYGSPCTGSSHRGNMKGEDDKTSAPQLVHWSSADAKLLLAENVTTGQVHKLEEKALQERFHVRFLTTQPKHVGFLDCSRLRGWHIAAIQLQYSLCHVCASSAI